MDARFHPQEFEIRKDVLRQVVSDYVGLMLGRFSHVYDDDLDARAYVGPEKLCDMVPAGPKVEVKVGQNKIDVNVHLADDKDGGIVCGPNKCNILGLFNLIRMQQVIPHNKAIILTLQFPTRSPQTFKDYNLFSLRGEVPADDFYKINGSVPPHVKSSVRLDEATMKTVSRAVGKTIAPDVLKHVRGVSFENPLQGSVAVERMKEELESPKIDADKLIKDLDTQFNALFSSALMESLVETTDKAFKEMDKKSAKLRKENK